MFVLHPYPSHILGPWCLGSQPWLNFFGLFFLLMKTNQMQLLIAGRCRTCEAPQGWKEIIDFLPTRLERMNSENLHRPSSRPINGVDLEDVWRNLSFYSPFPEISGNLSSINNVKPSIEQHSTFYLYLWNFELTGTVFIIRKCIFLKTAHIVINIKQIFLAPSVSYLESKCDFQWN